MTDETVLPPLVILAGTSESGKSTAGQHLARCGARRVKIRTILLRLASGREALHEGVATRIGFDHDEFLASLRKVAAMVTEPVVVLESCIDVGLSGRIKAIWPARCDLVFITAPHDLRVRRHAVDTGLTYEEAERRVLAKDARKRVTEQLPYWRRLANYWIENDQWLSSFTRRLDEVMARSINDPIGRSR